MQIYIPLFFQKGVDCLFSNGVMDISILFCHTYFSIAIFHVYINETNYIFIGVSLMFIDFGGLWYSCYSTYAVNIEPSLMFH